MMRFEEIASNAGKHAAGVGRQAVRPVFVQLLSQRRRRSLVSAWSMAGVAVVGAVVIALTWPLGEGSDGPAVSPTLAGVPSSCPVTALGETVFTPESEAPEDPPEVYEDVWFGTTHLWTLVDPAGEVWSDLPRDADGTLTEKTFWWSANYSADDPGEFTVTAEHLSGTAPQFEASQAGGTGFNPFMTQPTHESVTVVGLDLPESGCWRLSAEYKGASLSYVVWVEDENVESATTVATTTTSTTPTSLPEVQPTLPGNTLQRSWDDGLVFGEPMPWALAFDNGTCCIKTVTLDGGGSHLVSIGTQGGDQPFRLTVHGGRLVVGWGDIYAFDIAAGTSTLLAEATFHVPASDPSNVWMIGYPGARISEASPEVWQVDVTTGQATEPKLLESEGFVARGIPGGLALDSDNGIDLWDYESGEVVDSLGEGLSFVSDVTEDGRVAWCSDPCFEMVVTSLADGEERVYPRSGGEIHPYHSAAARFSDDGRYLAAPAGNNVMLIDTVTGEIRPTMTFPDATAPHLYVAWAPNNIDLFAADYSYDAGESVIGHYSLAHNMAEVTILPHGGTLSFVVLPTSETGWLVP